jgi:hypothetical protein
MKESNDKGRRGAPPKIGIRAVASFACELVDRYGLGVKEAARLAPVVLKSIEGPKRATLGAKFSREFVEGSVCREMRKIRVYEARCNQLGPPVPDDPRFKARKGEACRIIFSAAAIAAARHMAEAP